MSIIVDSNKLLYVVKRSSFGVRIDVLDEWIKWLSYVNDDDEKYLSENNKSLKEMSLEELGEEEGKTLQYDKFYKKYYQQHKIEKSEELEAE